VEDLLENGAAQRVGSAEQAERPAEALRKLSEETSESALQPEKKRADRQLIRRWIPGLRRLRGQGPFRSNFQLVPNP